MGSLNVNWLCHECAWWFYWRFIVCAHATRVNMKWIGEDWGFWDACKSGSVCGLPPPNKKFGVQNFSLVWNIAMYSDNFFFFFAKRLINEAPIFVFLSLFLFGIELINTNHKNCMELKKRVGREIILILCVCFCSITEESTWGSQGSTSFGYLGSNT